jgi:hypothetical protein
MVESAQNGSRSPGARALAAASLIELLTGVALLLAPSVVARLLLGSAPGSDGIAIARVTGISLLALAVACWPAGASRLSLLGMLTYTALVGVFLASLGIRGQASGKLLWPAVLVHLLLMVVLGRAWLRQRPRQVAGRTSFRRRSA